MNDSVTTPEVTEMDDDGTGGGKGFLISMAVLVGFLLFIAIGFVGAYFMMQPAS